MGWNIDNRNFDNIIIHGNNVVIHDEKDQHITLWVEKEIKKAAWQGNTIVVYLKSGETRKYLNHMHYVILPPTIFQKSYQFFVALVKPVRSRLPKFSREKTPGKYTIPSSTNITG